ncbi:hypothetical protein AeMF1_013765 [Aphanomyces euteiches]|nr:hypothetical protein AeMF1_013765 [Aphanomyces euteiches]
MAHNHVEVDEADSGTKEDLKPGELESLVLPENWLFYPQFACAHSKRAYDGWVKQPSPCCAAASLAGALNVVYGMSRNLSKSLSHSDIMSFYRTHFQERHLQHKLQLETALGTSLDGLEYAMLVSLEAKQLQYGGVGPAKLTKTLVRQCLHDCVKDNTTNDPGMKTLKEHLSQDSETFVAEEWDSNAMEFSNPMSSEWWMFNLTIYFHRMDGLAKLTRPEKPSTAICGNATVLDAATSIHNTGRTAPGTKLTSALFMGKKAPGCQVAISTTDSPMTQTQAWKQLWSKFTDDRTALIVHLKNHYALIFALREWNDNSKWTRQVLTARRGQRPTTWIDWDELRTTMLSWSGYKILSFTLEDD